MTTAVANSAVLAVFAVGLLITGRWGRTRSAQLVPTYLNVDDRAHRTRLLRRGSLACYVAAAVLAGVAVVGIV